MIVFDIKRYAINDGPGIRTTIFMKGCPLRCVWCHNPESWRSQPELLFKQKKCIGCNSCGIHPHQMELIRMMNDESHHARNDESKTEESRHARNDESKSPCSGSNPHSSFSVPHSSFESCPTLALEMCGREWTIDELLADVEKERDVMQDSGGGVTISGGEPLLQVHPLTPLVEGCEMSSGNQNINNKPAASLSPQDGSGEGLLQLLRELGRRGFHRAVDTTLYAPAKVVRAVASETDLFLVDLKVMDAEKHKRYTGVSNELILSNIRLLAVLQKTFIIRIPLIEGINADEENIEATARFMEEMRDVPVNLLPYHEMGRDKHARRGTTYNPDGIAMSTPSDDTLQRCVHQFAAHGITATIGG